MLQLRPNCESCDSDLGAGSVAYICTFECTFCEICTVNIHQHFCPNCQGNLEKRPIRPENLLEQHPASTERVIK
jgi:hypothetical protein